MGVLLDNQKALAVHDDQIRAVVERCRALEERVARLEARVQETWWMKLTNWLRRLG